MALTPAITDLDQLKDRPILSSLLAWNQPAVEAAKFDRDELSIYIARENIRDAISQLKAQGLINFLSDLTCADVRHRLRVGSDSTLAPRQFSAVLGVKNAE